jgi:limonene-1,2-epoxide hydrolase
MTDRMEVTRFIPADASKIFDLLRDPDGHVQIDASGMLMDSTGDPATKVGDQFVVHMDREALNDYPVGKYDVTIDITAFEQDREIAWTILGAIEPPIGHVYGYRLEATEGGTNVTSYYDWSNIHPTWRERDIFPVIPESALRATLGILDRAIRRTPAEAVVDAFIAAIEAKDLDAAAALLAEHVSYENVPMQPIAGRDTVKVVLSSFLDAASEVAWPVKRQVSSGNVVVNERLDRFHFPGGWLELPVAGFFEVDDDGLITLWRDYFDMATYTTQLAAVSKPA